MEAAAIASWRRCYVHRRYGRASLAPPASVLLLAFVLLGFGMMLGRGLFVGHRYAFVRVIGMNLSLEGCRYITLTGLHDRLPAVDPETGRKTC